MSLSYTFQRKYRESHQSGILSHPDTILSKPTCSYFTSLHLFSYSKEDSLLPANKKQNFYACPFFSHFLGHFTSLPLPHISSASPWQGSSPAMAADTPLLFPGAPPCPLPQPGFHPSEPRSFPQLTSAPFTPSAEMQQCGTLVPQLPVKLDFFDLRSLGQLTIWFLLETLFSQLSK